MLVCSVACFWSPPPSLILLHSSILNVICSKRKKKCLKKKIERKEEKKRFCRFFFFSIAKKKKKIKMVLYIFRSERISYAKHIKKERAPLESIPFLYMAMQNILLLLAFSIPVMKAVCRNLKFYLLLWKSLFIIACTLCSEQRC